MSSNMTTTPANNGNPPAYQAPGRGVTTNSKDPNHARKASPPVWDPQGKAKAGNSAQANGVDPFLGEKVTSAFAGLNLSATAKAFKPTQGTTPVALLSIGTHADTPVILDSGRASMPASTSVRPIAMAPVGSKSASSSPPRTPVRFTTDLDHPGPGGRFIQVQGVQGKDLGPEGIFTKLNGMPPYQENVCDKGKFFLAQARTANDMVVFIYSDSLAYTTTLFSLLDAEGQFTCKYVSHHAYAVAGGKEPNTQYCGQVTVNATFSGLTSKFATDRIATSVQNLLQGFGRVTSFTAASETAFPAMQFRAEFDSVVAANDVIAAYKPDDATADAGIENLEIKAVQYEPPTFGHNAGAYRLIARHSSGGTISPTTLATPSTSRSESKDTLIYSPTGRTAEREDANGNIVGAPGKVRVERCERSSEDTGQNFGGMPFTPLQPQISRYTNNEQLAFGPRQAYQEHDIHQGMMIRRLSTGLRSNHKMSGPQDVDEQRIIDGHDVRTTLMIRNVPADWTADKLLDILKTSTPGKYDFTYLRIDFQQNSAVGYAFVNFVSANALLRFVQANVGKVLPSMPGGKINRRPCAVSYANIQGYECLVAKFRNSSIMQEAFNVRPMLWHTDITAPTPDQVGQQLQFPQPDNNAKLQRSIENAGSQGLYSPRPRGTGHDGRRQHSQWDRGTPGQVQDEQQYMGGYSTNPQYTWGPAPPMFSPYGPQMHGIFPGAQPYMMPPQAFGMHGMHHDPQFQQPAPHFQGYNAHAASGLRTQTNGQLGYHYDTLPAYIQPVNQPYGTGVVMNREAEFEPVPMAMAHGHRNSTPRFFRERQSSNRGA